VVVVVVVLVVVIVAVVVVVVVVVVGRRKASEVPSRNLLGPIRTWFASGRHHFFQQYLRLERKMKN
jgi:hypothetical protein